MIYLEIINLNPVFNFVKNWMLRRGLLLLGEISIQPPTILLATTREDLTAIFYRKERKNPRYNASNETINPIAMYSPDLREDTGGVVEKAIVLVSGFNQGNLEDIAVFTHETAHFLQDVRGRWVSICGTIMEVEALIVEEMFRRDHGLESISREIAKEGYRLGP